MAGNFDAAFLAVIHAFVQAAFYPYSAGTCMEISLKIATFPVQAPDLNEFSSVKGIDARHAFWRERLQ